MSLCVINGKDYIASGSTNFFAMLILQLPEILIIIWVLQ